MVCKQKCRSNQGTWSLNRKIVTTYIGLFILNVIAWGWTFIAFHHYPMLLGTAFLAYSFGLRHAVDADHIAAIDNVTRKLMQEGKKPVSVGIMFALGHSTVVIVGSISIAIAAFEFQDRIEAFRQIGSTVGTVVSSLFLFAIGLVNLTVLKTVYDAFTRVRNGDVYCDQDIDLLLANRGFLLKLLRPVLALVRKSTHMYLLGILFGLGFDTATEIGVLAISAGAGSRGLSLCSILAFPILFAAGMTLIDATDNILMLGAYGWAFGKPVRKLYYNLTITAVSVVVAFVVGGIEALGAFGGHLHLKGTFWEVIAKLNGRFGLLGYGIVVFFVCSWILSILIYKWRKFELLELEPD